MKAYEIMEDLFSLARPLWSDRTCDTLKAGDPNTEVSKVAVAMFATVDIVRQARDWGAQLLIVHEPTYYNHWDDHSDDYFEAEKRRLIESSGLTIYRFHDHPHCTDPDIITEGEIRYLGLDCTLEKTDVFDLTRLHLTNPMTPRQLAKYIEDTLGIAHVRIAGAADAPCTRLSLMVGTPGGLEAELLRPETEIILTGEICEWALGEHVRDAAQLGYRKAILVLGHIGSERDGMKYTAQILKQRQPQLDVRYFEGGEVYTYSDSI